MSSPGTRAFQLCIDVALDDSIVDVTSIGFRCSLFGFDTVTDSLFRGEAPKSDGGWTKVRRLGAVSSASVAEAEDTRAASTGSSSEEGVFLRWRKEFTCVVDDAFIRRLNESALFPIFMYKTSTSDESSTPHITHYSFATILDLSAFLTSRVSVGRFFCSSDDPSASLELPPPGQSLHPCPPGLRYLHVDVALVNGEPLLRAEQLNEFNPLSITILSARDLPGVRANNQFSPFSLQCQFCAPVYVVIRPLIPEFGPRIVASEGLLSQSKLSWGYTTSFLTDGVERHLLEESLELWPLRIEIHDRDPIKIDGLARYDRLVDGTEDIDGSAVIRSEDGPSAAEAAAEAAEAAAAAVKPPKGKESRPLETEAVSPSLAPSNIGLNVFEVDKLYLAEAVDSWRTAGDINSHGTVEYRLDELLNDAQNMSAAFAKQHRALAGRSMKMTASILPANRRIMPKGGEEDWTLSAGERLVRKPGAYLETDATLGVHVCLQRPIRTLVEAGGEFIGPRNLPIRPFARAVFIMEYANVEMLQSINKGIDAINLAALGASIQGSLRSHQLTSAQAEAAENGSLHIICGFTIIDDACRTLVVEGLREDVESLMRAIPRSQNDRACRSLSNPDVVFQRRLYTQFSVDLKRVRLRDPLPVLCEKPEIYDRTKVSMPCFEALHSLLSVRKLERLAEAAILLPSAEQLLQVESKYGESVSLEDMDGRQSVKKPRDRRGSKQTKMDADAPVTQNAGDSAGAAIPTAAADVPARRKAATDSRNDAFEAARLAHRPPDFLGREREVLEEALEGLASRRADVAAERAADPVPAKFCYSGQKLQYTELKKGELRAKLSREKNSHFTYSKEYLAAAVSMVDDVKVAVDEARASQAKWMTAKGFTYPAPRKVSEFAAVPLRPSEARADELREMWVENEMHPMPVGRTVELPPGQPDFDSIPTFSSLFGGSQLPRYERPYDSHNLGSELRLPRGRLTLEKNSDFFKSVHLTGEGLALEKAETKRLEKAAWMSKVVVDSLDFKVGGFNVRDRPLQMSKTDDILHGPAQSVGLRIVRNATLPSGKRVPLRPPPISAFSSEPYEDPKDFTADLRPDDKVTFLEKGANGEPLNFVTFIHRETYYPKAQCATSHTAIAPLRPHEKIGLRWANLPN